MAAKKSFEERYYDNLEKDIERLEATIQSISDRIDRIADELSTHAATHNFKNEGPKWYDHKLAYIAGVCIFIFLLIIAAVLGVEVPKGLS